ncbi:hypothetical protein K402DRAFT_399005 [Aulographum hederae CBS 113979]|uniref:Uncharacterized protein n=1 Tax=Aulographum hederae CBS 113979 TaxID=1176131 RepID=A0A6G1GIY9_9PEZI|nr:hypothetical protein K402DRAFT_399005 [Aulographum hederae CBS 113979]
MANLGPIPSDDEDEENDQFGLEQDDVFGPRKQKSTAALRLIGEENKPNEHRIFNRLRGSRIFGHRTEQPLVPGRHRLFHSSRLSVPGPSTVPALTPDEIRAAMGIPQSPDGRRSSGGPLELPHQWAGRTIESLQEPYPPTTDGNPFTNRLHALVQHPNVMEFASAPPPADNDDDENDDDWEEDWVDEDEVRGRDIKGYDNDEQSKNEPDNFSWKSGDSNDGDNDANYVRNHKK